MATLLQTSNFNGTNGSHFYIELWQTNTQNVEENTSTVTYDLYFGSKDGYSGSGAAYYGYIGKNWEDRSQIGSGTSIGVNTKIYVGSTTRVYNHNSDGTCEASYYALLDTPWSLGAADLGGTFALPTIPRDFSQQPSITKGTTTPNSVVINWNTSEICDLIKYKLNSGSWVQVWTGSATSGSFTISGLTFDTTYTITGNFRRKDSQRSMDSNSLSVKTNARPIRIRVNGQWKQAIPYVRVNGQWKKAQAYIRANNTWKEGI